MSNNNLNTNSVTQTETSNQTQNSNHPKDYFELFTKHYKAIISAIITVIPILGAVLTFLIYIYKKNYLAYFSVSEDWVEVELSKSIFNLIYKGCLGVVLLLPNAIALSPLLFKKETIEKVKSELKFLLISFIVIFLIAIPIKSQTNLSYQSVIIGLGLLWALAFGLPVIIVSLITILNAVIILFNYIYHPLKTIKLICTYVLGIVKNIISNIAPLYTLPIRATKRSIHYITNINLRKFFKAIATGIDKINNFSPEPNQNATSEEHITNKNKALFILIILILGGITFIVFYVSSLGTTIADEEKSFSIIKLNDIEVYDDLKEDNNGDNPYIQSNKRIVNSKVILSENDDYYLVINSYIDETGNDLKLYIFTREQMIIEKKNVAFNLIELLDKDNKKVIS